MYKYILFIAACLSIFSSCLPEPSFSEIPYIESRGMTKNVMNQTTPSFQDSTETTIYFEDGDGDLGGDSLAIFVIDKRTDNVDIQYRVTEIPIEGVSNAISGTISFPILASCCIYDNGQFPCSPSDPEITQEVIYEVYLVDRAGNESNRIELSPITLNCR